MSGSMQEFWEIPPGARFVLAREAINSALDLNAFLKLDGVSEVSVPNPSKGIIVVDEAGRSSAVTSLFQVNAVNLANGLLAFINSQTEIKRVDC
jgi:hypothetical protein